MTENPKWEDSMLSLVDPIATLDHLDYLDATMESATEVLKPMYSYVHKLVRTPTEKDVTKLTNMYLDGLQNDLELLWLEAVRERVEIVVKTGMTGGSSGIIQSFQYLLGMAVGLKLRPVPSRGHQWFFPEGMAES